MLEDTPFDLVLTDLFMPRIDGIALTRAIKSMGLTGAGHCYDRVCHHRGCG